MTRAPGDSSTSCGDPVASIAAAVEHDDPLAEREDLAMRVRDVENRDAVRLVPGAQVVHDARLRDVIERRQRLVEQQDRRIGDERSRQRHTLTLAAGDLAPAGATADARCGTTRRWP